MTQLNNELVAKIADAMGKELKRRNEWYGLDNWTYEEVVRFVLDERTRIGKEELAS